MAKLANLEMLGKTGSKAHLLHLEQREKWGLHERLRRREANILNTPENTRVHFPEQQRACPNTDCEHREFIRTGGFPCNDCRFLEKPDRYDNKELSLAEGEIFMDAARVQKKKITKAKAVKTIEAAMARRNS